MTRRRIVTWSFAAVCMVVVAACMFVNGPVGLVVLLPTVVVAPLLVKSWIAERAMRRELQDWLHGRG